MKTLHNRNSRAQFNRWTDVMQTVNKDEHARSQSRARSRSQLRARFNDGRTKPNSLTLVLQNNVLFLMMIH